MAGEELLHKTEGGDQAEARRLICAGALIASCLTGGRGTAVRGRVGVRESKEFGDGAIEARKGVQKVCGIIVTVIDT